MTASFRKDRSETITLGEHNENHPTIPRNALFTVTLGAGREKLFRVLWGNAVQK